MNPNDPRYGAAPDMSEDERRFDAAARALHAQALNAVSPPTRARLRIARHAAGEQARAPRRGLGWVLASGCAAVFALAIGVQLQRAPPAADPPSAAPTMAAMLPAPEAAAYDSGTALASLDENPDFYLWLASADDLPATE